jgi:adenylosuccinate lyase
VPRAPKTWPALPMLCQRPLNSSNLEVPSYRTFTVTSQNSLEFQDIELGLESYDETIPEHNSRDRLTSTQKLMKALSSAKLRYSSRQKVIKNRTMSSRGRDPKSRDRLAYPQRSLKALSSAKLQRASRQKGQVQYFCSTLMESVHRRLNQETDPLILGG